MLVRDRKYLFHFKELKAVSVISENNILAAYLFMTVINYFLFLTICHFIVKYPKCTMTWNPHYDKKSNFNFSVIFPVRLLVLANPHIFGAKLKG